MNPYETTLVDALSKPILVISNNPRSHRMRYINAMNNTRIASLEVAFRSYKAITVICRQKQKRIILGPKDFDAYLPIKLDIDTCSQEELEKAFKETYPLQIINLMDIEEEFRKMRRMTPQSEIEVAAMMKKEGEEALHRLGFGKVMNIKDVIKKDERDEPFVDTSKHETGEERTRRLKILQDKLDRGEI